MNPTDNPPEFEANPLDGIREHIRACIQCGTCTGSCPNADEMDLTPRHLWRLVLLGRLDPILASRTFILCSDCYTCALRCPRGLPLTEAMEALKGIAFTRKAKRHRASRLFYEQFMQTVRRYGRIHETAFMRRYLTAMASPTVPFRFVPMGLKLMRKGKVELKPGGHGNRHLDILFERVAELERESALAAAEKRP